MPLELKELRVKITVAESQESSTNLTSTEPDGEQEAMVQLIVQRVLEILAEKEER